MSLLSRCSKCKFSKCLNGKQQPLGNDVLAEGAACSFKCVTFIAIKSKAKIREA